MKSIFTAAFAAAAIAASAGANATLFTVSGTNTATGNTVSGSANFTWNSGTNTLTLVLTNTTGTSIAQSDAISGILFDVAGSGQTLSLTSTTASTLFSTQGGAGSNNVAINGSWTTALGTGGEYGVATTGASGLFSAGGITLGTGGPDYGIVGATTDMSTFASAQQYPFARNAITFAFNTTGDFSGIGNVRIYFGTAGDNLTSCGEGRCPIPNIPEPSTWALMLAGLGLFGFGFIARRRSMA